ncbi:MAG: calcium-binding protein [Pseudomonadota bacterium]
MANVILVSDTTTSQTLTNSGDFYYLAEGVTHYSTQSTTVSTAGNLSDLEFLVHGVLLHLGSSGEAIDLTSAGLSNVTVTISATGSIDANADWRAVYSAANNLTVINHGRIQSTEAINSSGSNAKIFNFGTLVQENPTALVNAPLISLSGINTEIVNSGSILAQFGFKLLDGGKITNTGEISTTHNGITNLGVNAENLTLINAGIFTSGTTVFQGSSSARDLVTNTGTMVGAMDFAGAADRLDNSGTIQGAVTFGNAVDTVVNSGEMIGDIALNGDDDNFVNTGLVIGTVDLGADADTYSGRGLGLVSEQVLGGTGDDTLRGGDQGDDLDGGNDDDLVVGLSGDDTLEGGAGNDTVLGGAGSDSLRGNSGADVINGQDGNDTLIGGSGDDRLFGGQGNDDITAGTGADILRGGGGDDVFVFNSVDETGTGAFRDRIIGFEDGADRIDLSAFIDLTFSASGAALGDGTASVWFEAVSVGAQTMLRIDIDGDGAFDGQILLVRSNLALFDQSDLILG